MEIARNVFSVGVRDWNRRLFDALIPLPQGTSYNSYLVVGKEKTALIDTVNPGFENELIRNVEEHINIDTLHYLVMNHAEPDHASAIPVVMNKSKAILLTSLKGAEMAKNYYKVPADRIKAVKEGDEIDLGGKTLRFIDAPFLHWPETMFSYLVEDKILFPCDFFGSHSAFGTYDVDSEDMIPNAKKYFGEIMMPFKTMGKKAMEKLDKMEIKMIAPSHGPIHKKPEMIMAEYKKWTNGETRKKVLIAYTSMWGSTENMVNVLRNSLISQGVEVCSYNLAVADIGDIAKDLVDCRAVVLGSPHVLGSVHPLTAYATYLVKALRPPVKYAAFIGSYGWGQGVGKKEVELLGQTDIELVGAIEVNGRPSEEDFAKVIELAHSLCAKLG